MSDREAMDISVDIDDNAVMIWFRWDYIQYARPVYVSRADGNASLGLAEDSARELHRKLGETLDTLDKQNWADAGHPDPEEAAAEAEARGDPAREPSDARSGA